MHLRADRQDALVALVRHEQRVFATKIRIARAVLGWSQTDLAQRVGMTQRAIHKLEQGATEPRRATVLAIEAIWHSTGIAFEDLPDGSFRLLVTSSVIDGEDAGVAASAGSNVVRHPLSRIGGRYHV
jgi:transcriptional regulator with XRE-family HTH domain